MAGVPVWSHDGMICTGETYKNVVKLTFAKGAALKDPSRLFNSSLDGNVRRAIDFHEDEAVDERLQGPRSRRRRPSTRPRAEADPHDVVDAPRFDPGRCQPEPTAPSLLSTLFLSEVNRRLPLVDSVGRAPGMESG